MNVLEKKIVCKILGGGEILNNGNDRKQKVERQLRTTLHYGVIILPNLQGVDVVRSWTNA